MLLIVAGLLLLLPLVALLAAWRWTYPPSPQIGAVPADFRVIICGSGFSGICMGIKLKQAGIPFIILEKNSELGGTWFENSYPGCACDVASHLYSYSFEINPHWTSVYPPRSEIRKYQYHCVKKYGVEPFIQLNTEVKTCTFKDNKWIIHVKHLDTDKEDDLVGNVFVCATGQLNIPKTPSFPGISSFKGVQFHTAQWNHNVDLRGKRVGVIGCGPSSAQVFPEVAKEAKEAHNFIRSPPFVLPKNERKFTPLELSFFLRTPFNLACLLYRLSIYLTGEVLYLAMFNDGVLFPRIAKRLVESYRDDQLKTADPALRELLTPTEVVGCKRIVFADNFYETAQRKNVHLHKAPQRITEKGVIVTDKNGKDQEIELDVLIWGTGFESQLFLHPLKIFGKNGKELHDQWGVSPEAYFGLCVPNFPNFFIMYGPNTNLGSNSIIFMIEAQVHCTLSLLGAMLARNATTVEVTADGHAKYKEQAQARMGKMVWQSTCHSWYRNSQGVVTSNCPWSTVEYWAFTRAPVCSDFHLK